MPVVAPPSLEAVRAHFPALASGFAFMDNAGGAQVPRGVADAVRDYMLTSYVQVGASYPASRRATAVVEDAHEMMNVVFGGDGLGKVILGSSSSTLCRMLSDCYAEILGEDDEVVVAQSGHEANVHPWTSLAKRGVTVKIWEANSETGVCEVEQLARLLSRRTKIVAFPHVSNILGAVEDIEPAIRLAHEAGARVVLDSVAYAPHLAMNVAKWGVDFCVFACYKMFGPHMGALWGSNEALGELTGRNHPFIQRTEIPDKFELGGVLHEGCAGLLALKPYFQFLTGTDRGFDRTTIESAFETISQLEEPLTRTLLDFLASKPDVRVIGPASYRAGRIPTVSFIHRRRRPAEIVGEVDRHDIGIRHGHFYSWRLMEALGIPPQEGVVRVSLVHYNSGEEVAKLIDVLDDIL